MIKFFRKIRQNLISEGNTGKYLKYAIGEILLVMIGILLALQVTNWNESRQERDREVIYLTNIKSDLELSVTELKNVISKRESLIESAEVVLDHFNGKPVADWNVFNKRIVDVYTWERFYLIDNTYQELKNSGNFAIISNDSIKSNLLELELLYKKLKYKEDHCRYDTEKTLYEHSYGKQDINSMSKNYVYQITNGQSGDFGNLSKDTFGGILKDQRQKNGFAFASLNFAGMNMIFRQLEANCNKIIDLINKDIGLDQ